MLVLELLAACERAYESPTYSTGRDAFYYVRTDRYQIIAARGTLTEGTEAISDWYNDFHAQLVPWGTYPFKVHEGFYASFSALWPKISVVPKLPLFITGHSKGGAVAQLMGVFYHKLRPTIITFGSPKVGNAAFAEAVGWAQLWRYENAYDLVPKLPALGYTPAGAQIVSPRAFESRWNIRENHMLETGYKPWIKEMLCASQSSSS